MKASGYLGASLGGKAAVDGTFNAAGEPEGTVSDIHSREGVEEHADENQQDSITRIIRKKKSILKFQQREKNPPPPNNSENPAGNTHFELNIEEGAGSMELKVIEESEVWAEKIKSTGIEARIKMEKYRIIAGLVALMIVQVVCLYILVSRPQDLLSTRWALGLTSSSLIVFLGYLFKGRLKNGG